MQASRRPAPTAAPTVANALQPLGTTLNLASDVEIQIVQMDDSAALRALCSGAIALGWNTLAGQREGDHQRAFRSPQQGRGLVKLG